MKSSNIGGQAVLEGIMMKNGEDYAVAVRKQNGEIALRKEKYKGAAGKWRRLTGLPLIRGVFAFADSLILGLRTLSYSAEFYEEEGRGEERKKEEKGGGCMMGAVIAFSVAAAAFLFMVLPYLLSGLFAPVISSYRARTVIESFLRIGIFFLYLLLISRMEEMRRTFMYHGAEHKCINCIEGGLPLTVENVKKSSRQHRRCGTSFLFFVVFVGMLLFLFISVSSPVARIFLRIALIPVIAGVAYELLRLAGRSENMAVRLLSGPGLWFQRLTTREPDEGMIEVAIKAVEAVFDWRAYEAENFDA